MQCHDCGCEEGQLHEPGCDMESCPFCGGQLITCGCCYKILEIDASSGTRAYSHGLNKSQQAEWDEKLREKGLVPYISYPNICSRCGRLWPEIFRVPDEEWRKYVEIHKRGKMLCRPCFDEIRQLVDSGEQRKHRK